MSLWALVGNASWIVLLVLLLLVAASVVSWMIIFQRGILLRNAQQAMIAFEDRFWSGMDLILLYKEVQQNEQPGSGVEHIFKAGFAEFTRLRNQGTVDPDAVMEGAQRAMRVAISREQERLEGNLPFLASVGSTCPYLGLFGTVVGIMNSFRGLAVVQQPTLASVAPGIAEALLTTAVGLVAAIPAVVAYNRYASRVEALVSNYEIFADEFSSILHRKVYSRT
ncbi:MULTISPECIES: protein TolQ [Gammaproteobacteria]|uniref:protein TolQ n=1 Tax=Gammaproteobacteria TaxID=1236 RepID=UPI001ADCFD2A|nr:MULTISPECIES: protein TolQ [Gammaproteobacteria]MBO9482566.1 protein TolQ [Salinisphaera sp. G21_0]MBO9495781.1 protein TolQ [Thalassotalea sp. G20_0]